MDFFLKLLLAACLYFVTFSFAGTEPWAFSILQGGVLVCVGLWMLAHEHWASTPLFKIAFWGLAFLTGYALIQTVCPHTLLDSTPWYPSTLIPLYTWEHACTFLTYLAVVFITCQVAQRTPDVRQLMLLAVGCALLVAITANVFDAGAYIEFFTGRRGGFGPFLNRNHAGEFLAMATVLMCGYNVSGWLRQNAVKRNVAIGKQIAGWVLVIVLGFSCIFTRSRGGMLSLGTGLFVYGLLAAIFLPQTRRARFTWLCVWGICLVLVVSWVELNVDAINAFARRATGASVETRKMLYRAAWELLAENPYFGIGIGAMPVAITPYLAVPIPRYVERLHNDWLELLLGMGYVGMTVMVVIIGWFVWTVLQRMGRVEPYKKMVLGALLGALVAMSVGSLVDFHFSIPADAFLFFMIVGLTASPSFDKGRLHLHALTAFKRILAIGVLLAAMWLPLQKTRTWRLFLFGKGLRPQAQLAMYRQGLELYPGPRFALRLGNAYYKAGMHSKDADERRAQLQQAQDVAETYLRKYPKEKELSRLYLRARRGLQQLPADN